MKNKFYFLLILLFFFNKGFSQISYKKVDSTSYALYQLKNWKQLTKFAEQIEKDNFDFFYYNFRVGIAYYELKDYSKSILYFEKALKNNSTNVALKKYLYWNYIFLNQNEKAKIIWNSLDERTQQELKFQAFKPRYLDYIYAEGGQNLQRRRASKNGSITYLNIGLNHQLTYRLWFYQAIYYQTQQQEFVDFSLLRYFAKPVYKLKNNFDLGLSFNYSHEKNIINFKQDITQTITENNVVLDDGFTYDRIRHITETNTNKGKDDKKEFQLNLGVTKYFEKAKIGVFGGFASKTININTTDVNKGVENVVYLYQGNVVYNKDFPYKNITNIKIDSTALKTNIGMLFGYNLTTKLGLAAEATVINYDKQNEFNYTFTVDYKLNDTFDFTANFVQKGKFEYYYYQSAYLISSLNKAKRFGLISKMKLNNKIAIFVVYHHDIDTLINKIKANSNTFILGLKIKL